jgi:hypothetical protein
MRKSIQNERKILIVAGDKDLAVRTQGTIGEHLSACQFLSAADAPEAMLKIENDPPHLVVVEEKVAKTKIADFIYWILERRKPNNMSVIWMRPIPEDDLFVDEVVTGQLQFVEGAEDQSKWSKALSRSMNYLSVSEKSQEYTLRFLSSGELLIKQGEVGNSVFLVKRGELKALLHKDEKELLLGRISAGEFVGEMAYINGEARSANVVAESDCELIEFPADKLDHMLFQKPSWSKALMRTLSKRLKRTNESL